ncbi:MAG: hypothetical protein V4667_06705 [Bacteroidota bacterium]
MNLKVDYKKYPLLISLVIVVSQFTIIQLLFNTRFNTNDDVMMMFLSRGVVFTNEPTPLLLYSNVIYGKYLVFFTQLFSKINFYTINNFILLIFSLTAISYNILLNSNYKTLLLFNLVIFPFTFNLFIVIQFTILSSVLFLSGIISFFNYFKYPKKKLLYYSFFSIVLASLIRFEQTILLLLFTAPIVIVFIYKIKANIKRIIVVLSLIAATCVLLSIYSKNYYTSKANYDFENYNVKIASLFYDYNLIEKISHETKSVFLKKLNISTNDTKLYDSWYLTPLLINNARFWDDSEINKLFSKIENSFFNFKILKEESKGFLSIYLTLLIVVLSIIYYISTKKINLLLLFFSSLLFAIIISQTINYFLKEMPYRLLMPVIFSIFSLLLFYFITYHKIKINSVFKYSIVIILCLSNIKYVKSFNEMRKDLDKFNYNELKSIYTELDSTKTYIFHPYLRLFTKINKYDTFNWTNNKLVGISTSLLTQHPSVVSNYKNFKYGFDFEILLNKNIRFVASKKIENSFFPSIKKYYQEHYNLKIDIIQDKKIYSNDYYSYKYIYLGKYKN